MYPHSLGFWLRWATLKKGGKIDFLITPVHSHSAGYKKDRLRRKRKPVLYQVDKTMISTAYYPPATTNLWLFFLMRRSDNGVAGLYNFWL